MNRMKKHLLLSLILVGLLPFLSRAQLMIDHVTITPIEGHGLRYEVSFQTDQPSTAYLEYGEGKYTHLSKNQTQHRIILVGLQVATNYEVTVHAFNETGANASGPYPLQTAAVPTDIVIAADSIFNDPLRTEGYVLTDARGASIPSQIRLFDRMGNLVWYDYTRDIGSPCIGNNFSTRNTFLQIYGDCQVVLELSFFGDTIQKIDISGIPGNLQVHHDLYVNKQGNLVLLVAEGRAVDKSSVGGRADALVVGDGYLEIDATGNIVSQWSIFDHRDPLQSRDAGSFWDQLLGEPAEDWTHANSIAEDTDGHYLMSLNALDQVIKIHRETGEILWTLGREGDFSFEPPDAAFKNQHTFWGIGDHHYTVFDNQGAGSFSRGMEFELDTLLGIAKLVFIQDADSTLSTGIVGSTYKLENGNMLSSFGRTGTIQEVDSLGEVVWFRDEGNIINYRSFYVPYIYPALPPLQLFDTLICHSARPFTPEMNVAGGYFEGPGFQNNTLDPSMLTPGHHELVYTYAYLRDTFDFTISAVPTDPTIEQSGSYLRTEAEGTYQWLLDGEFIEGATSDSLLIFANGTYQLQLRTDTGCHLLSNSLVIATVNTEEIAASRLLIYPNPNRGTFQVECQGLQTRQLQLVNLLGQVVYQAEIKDEASIILQPIVPGSYWLIVQLADGKQLRRQVMVR